MTLIVRIMDILAVLGVFDGAKRKHYLPNAVTETFATKAFIGGVVHQFVKVGSIDRMRRTHTKRIGMIS